MGPAKGTQIINKAIIKGCVDQQQPADTQISSKPKQKKRKIAELDPKWSKDELRHFYEAYRLHGKDWKKISLAVASKSSDMVKSLYRIHRTFLSLPERQATATGFIALVTGDRNVLDESTSHRGGDQAVRASGKARKRGETNEGLDQHHSCHDRTISGFSSSFKKRYYGELFGKGQIQTVGRRTTRMPVTVPADRNATDDDMPKFEKVNDSSRNNAEDFNNVCTNSPMEEFSPNGNFGITEANKADQDHAFLDPKGAGEPEIYQSQHLKKRKFQQIMDKEVPTGQVEHEIMLAAKTGMKLADSLNQQQVLSDHISEDDMLVLDVLQSLVNAPSKTSKLEINIPSGSHGKTYSALSNGMEEGHSPIDLAKQGNQISKGSAPKTRQKRHKKLLNAEVSLGAAVKVLPCGDEVTGSPGNSPLQKCKERVHTKDPKWSEPSPDPAQIGATCSHPVEVPAKEYNISVANLVQPEVHTVGITEAPLFFDSKEAMPETSVNSCAEVDPCAPAETKAEIKMSRRTKRKSEMHFKTKYVPCKWTEGSDNLQARKLQHCLSSELFRKWCTYEWFYSAVDYPWFSNNEFVSYLNHANLCHIPRLTRSEWSTIRSSLGKPRRFSDQLLTMEKEKLEDYRENVRKIYAQLRDGSRDSLPADLARPFSIGQTVIVRHPSSRALFDGKVVMMGQDSYKVQFGNPDLGLDIVKDTDCMPANWLDNHPDDMRSYFSNNGHILLEMENIHNLVPSKNLYHATNGVSVPEQPKSLHLKPDEQFIWTANSERPSNRTPNGTVLSRGGPDNKFGQSEELELESYVTSIIQRSLSQASQIVDEAMQANSDDEAVGTLNQATNCVDKGSEAAVCDAQIPNLISNCIATVISIKHLSDSRHAPANIAGVLEHVCSMLRPSCPENLAVYKDIESYLIIIANQILALVPTLDSDPALVAHM